MLTGHGTPTVRWKRDESPTNRQLHPFKTLSRQWSHLIFKLLTNSSMLMFSMRTKSPSPVSPCMAMLFPSSCSSCHTTTGPRSHVLPPAGGVLLSAQVGAVQAAALKVPTRARVLFLVNVVVSSTHGHDSCHQIQQLSLQIIGPFIIATLL